MNRRSLLRLGPVAAAAPLLAPLAAKLAPAIGGAPRGATQLARAIATVERLGYDAREVISGWDKATAAHWWGAIYTRGGMHIGWISHHGDIRFMGPQ